MSTPKIKAKSGIIYVRAALRPFAKNIRTSGGIIQFLSEYFEFQELFAPYFRRARPFWESSSKSGNETNSGALGKKLAKCEGAVISKHPSHSFVGLGENVERVLANHDYKTSCFEPIKQLAQSRDFSMLLLGCCESSPGFSSVHATQFELGLSQKHLFRYLIRWDVEENGKKISVIPNESPGCSRSFGNFYSAYEEDDNLCRGKIFEQDFLFVKSAAKAMESEKKILQPNPRFVRCANTFCSTCSFRLY